MKDFRGVVRLLITGRFCCKLLILTAFLMLPGPGSAWAQTVDPAKSITDLKEGWLLIRMPSSRSKIDTLQAMVLRAKDPEAKMKLERLLTETIEERDALVADYTAAFKNHFPFSKTAWFFDYEAYSPEKARYLDMEGNPRSWNDIAQSPVFFLRFERTEESRIDALVIYDQQGRRIPSPFPNNFTRGGLQFLFVKVSEKKFPDWRVSQMNKKLYRYYSSLRRQ